MCFQFKFTVLTKFHNFVQNADPPTNLDWIRIMGIYKLVRWEVYIVFLSYNFAFSGMEILAMLCAFGCLAKGKPALRGV